MPEDWQGLMLCQSIILCDSSKQSLQMNAEAQSRVLSASQKAASSVFANGGDDEGSLNVVKEAPVRGDLRRVEYSAEMAEISFFL